MVAYLKLMEVYGRENGGGVFLWLVSNINVLVTASCVMAKCRTGVFVSVFCNARESMDSPHNEEGHRDSAVSLYFLEITHFIFAEEQAALVGPNCKLYLQPEWSQRDKMMPLMVDYVMKNTRWILSLQTHFFFNTYYQIVVSLCSPSSCSSSDLLLFGVSGRTLLGSWPLS